MKFVMFPSGVGFFPQVARHDECYVVNSNNEREEPIAAGVVLLTRTKEAIVLDGASINLGLSADTAYPDWLERHVQSGLFPQRKTYNMGGRAFFLPFGPIQQYGASGIGKSIPEYGEAPKIATMDEVIACIRDPK